MLLSTKFHYPKIRKDIVAREPLYARLNEGLNGNLITVSAPAGFGKSTLVRSWIDEIETTTYWLSLDENDNDPARFAQYLSAALQQELQWHGAQEAWLVELINNIDKTGTVTVLVLDDYHLIHNQQIHQMMQFLLDHQPHPLKIITISRQQLSLSLSRLRVQNLITEIKESDLRFTLSETNQFLNDSMGLHLSEEQMIALNRRTEGWVAGLQLAGLSLKDADDVSSLIASFRGDNRYVVYYLMEEIIERLPNSIQNFLLQTSILERITASLADAVTKQTNSQQIIKQLEADNLFIIPLDGKQYWYRYHQLFRDFLRYRLGKDSQLFQQRAAAWYFDNGYTYETVEHAIAANDNALAARSIEKIAPELSSNGELSTLLKWLHQLPDQQFLLRPNLALEFAWALIITGDIPKAEQLLARIQPQTIEQKGILAAIYAASNSIVGRLEDVTIYANEALENVQNPKWRAIAATSLGLANRISGQWIIAEQALTEASQVCAQIGDIQNQLLTLGNKGRVQYGRGQIETAQLTFATIEQLLEQHHGHLAAMGGIAYLGQAEMYYDQNELEKAASAYHKAIELINQWEPNGVPDYLVESYVGLARV